MRIALDAMGGDFAPREIVRGALRAAEDHPDHNILLVGDRAVIGQEMSEAGGAEPFNVSVIHASQAVGMDEKPVEAIRSKPDSSVLRTIRLLAQEEADVAISAGNTGAMVAATTLSVKLLPGVRRTGIAVNLPGTGGCCTLVDVGANLNCKPIHLLQYGIMASVFHSANFDCESPRVGILNVGEEQSKGGALMKQAAALLAAAPVNFHGNAEGRDIFNGKFQVVVCDGFVGNALIKAAEGFGESLADILRTAIFRDVWGRLSFNLMRPVLLNLQRRVDFASYGGAPLLGAEGGVIICHGRSSARAVRNSVSSAVRFIKIYVNGQISAALSVTNNVQRSEKE
jgi:glycerol-3-phosphate acyltransferase PlsX